MPQTTSIRTSVSTAQTIFLLECRHTDTQSHRRNWSTYPIPRLHWLIESMFNIPDDTNDAVDTTAWDNKGW